MESESNDSREVIHDEDENENPPKKARDPKTDDLISKFLMQGHVLVPLACPDCASPLIKSMKRSDDEYEEYYEAGGFLNLEIKTVRRLKAVKRGDIIGCVPYCVSCKAVVVTNQEDLSIMWEERHKHLMAEKGAVLLAMDQADKEDHQTTMLAQKSRLTSSEKKNSQSSQQKPSRRPSVTKQMRNGIVLLSRTEVDSDEEMEKDTSEEAPEEEEVTTTSEKAPEEEERKDIVANSSIPKEDKKEFVVSTTNSEEKELPSSRNTSILVKSNSDEENDIDVTTVPYEKRRQIATKVLGSKMVQGYSLSESQCAKCTMPLMEKPGSSDQCCVVCPVLKKKIQKKNVDKAQREKERKKEQVIEPTMENQKTLVESTIKEPLATDNGDNHPNSTLQRDHHELSEHEEHDVRIEDRRIEDFNKSQQIRQLEEQLQLERGASIRSRYERDNYYSQSQSRLLVETDRLRNSSNPYESKRGHLIEELRRLEEEQHDQERERLIEDLRRAKEQREADAQRLIKEQMEKEQISRKAKLREIEIATERERLMEELRIAKAEKVRSEMRHQEEMYKAQQEKKETEEIMKVKLDEYERMVNSFRNIEAKLKEEATRREEELKKAEERAKDADLKLRSWKAKSEQEAAEARQIMKEAQQQLLQAEETRMEAEELAIEAQKARELGFGDHSRLLAMYKKAESLKASAERDEEEARIKFVDAKRKLDSCENVLSTTEKKLAESKLVAEKGLKEAKLNAKLSAQNSRLKLRNAENELVEARFGSDVSVSAAGDDWEARRLLGKKALAKKAIEGWAVLPQYCSGRMCNFTPLVGKNGVFQCVVCQGTGNGRDGFYDEISSAAMHDETGSFISRRNRFNNINPSSQFSKHDVVASREVGKRILEGWQLSESPCPTCMKPLMRESFGSHDVCIFCDINGGIGSEHAAGFEDLDDVSVSSRRSITLELPEDFDPSDSNAMAALIANATKTATQSSNKPISRNRLPSQRSGKPMQPVSSRKSRSNAPDMRNSESSKRSSSRPRRSSSRSRPEPSMNQIYISAQDYDEEDAASGLSEDASVAQSVASTTLEAILTKIESCKSKLKATEGDDEMSVAERSKADDLLKKLASAAIAVKKLESSAE